jgi:hemin uptake protein HemP
MTRHRLADRRAHETIAIEHDGQRYKVGLGRELKERRYSAR